MSAWKLEVRSSDPSTSFGLSYDGTQCMVRNDGIQWELLHRGDVTRLGRGSLRWPEALWRAIQAIEAH